mmetsp:Transcript_20297/g.46116  ORF Transcript_20297/g.46116 Transcript_20297/m.46116 type:complete len:102 (-) Transcript_20297:108-413(-)
MALQACAARTECKDPRDLRERPLLEILAPWARKDLREHQELMVSRDRREREAHRDLLDKMDPLVLLVLLVLMELITLREAVCDCCACSGSVAFALLYPIPS